MEMKNKIRLIAFLIISIILFTSFKPIDVIAVDDNYSTYLYNQDINVDNDKAHLLSEQSDGSNSYRNLFQSNFLFPAKLQSNMLSTSQTSSFSHYSFNQFYFDNLDNDYAYQSNDNSQNFETSIIPNEFDVLNGTNIVNGSLEIQDSEFGKYNATYSFDDYSESESNYGNYNATYSFWNDIGKTDLDISFIDYKQANVNIDVIDELNNHNDVLRIEATANEQTRHYFDISDNGILEYYFSITDNSKTCYISLYENSILSLQLYHQGSTNNFYYYNGTTYHNIGNSNSNEWYHFKVEWYSDNTVDIYLNGILKINRDSITINMVNGLNRFTIKPYTTTVNFDAIGFVGIDDYNENDNTNPYGLQSELENDFVITYNYNISYYIKKNDNYFLNSYYMYDNSSQKGFLNENHFSDISKGLIYFSINFSNVNKKHVIIVRDNSDSHSIYLRLLNGILEYYDFSYHTIKNLNSNEIYNIKINFNCNSQWNITINNVFYGNYDFYGNPIQMDCFRVYSIGSYSNYGLILDNLDYSWNNGYYENRINDVIPLNDSNYNMYKSEFNSNKEIYRLIPNQDLGSNWDKEPPYMNKYELMSDFNDSTYLYTYSISLDEKFGFTNLPNDFPENSYYVEITYRLKGNDYIFTSDTFGYRMTYISNSYFADYTYSGYRTKTQINSFTTEVISQRSGQKWSNIDIKIFYEPERINLEKEQIIEYESIGKPVLFTLHYGMCLNTDNSSLNISIYNYDISNYFNIKDYIDYYSFSEKSFIFNESAYFRFNKFKIRVQTYHYLSFNLFVDKLILNITYVIQNNEGYQEIIQYNHRFDNSDNYKGYSKFELLIFNDSIKYRYSEINFEMDDYIYDWITYNTSNIDVKNIEIQSHCRYGLNTLDIEIINFYYIIYINYDIMLEFREQSRKELETHKIKSSFNYTSYTRNYLDLTGIIGNYSYNTFKGCRSLYGAISEIFHRNFQIPYFSDDIDVSIPLILPDDDFSNPAEPEPPTQYYWEYETFRTEYHQDININIGNWSIQFSQMKSTTYKAKYFYQPNSISKDDLGSWKWKIKFTDAFSYTVDFNFMRNAVKSIINLVLLFGQWIGYLALASASYIFMYLGTNILVFLWNTLVYALFYALIYVIWHLYEGLFLLLNAIWLGLIWLYENYLIPFYIWFTEIAIPYLIEYVIIPAIAFTLTLIIWCITLGRIDFWDLYDVIHAQLIITSDIFIEIVIEIFDHIVEIVMFIGLYLLLILLCLLKHVVIKARGYSNRAKALRDSYEAYLYPIEKFYQICIRIKNLIAQWF